MSTGVMLAFVPTDGEWCKQPDPHMTLVYCGSIEEVPFEKFNDLAKDAITLARTMRPFTLDVLGVDVFGDEEKVDVLRLESTSMVQMARSFVEKWNASQHPFNPHATVGPQGSAEGLLPTKLYFEEIQAVWGNRELRFRLGSY